jgi:1-acyl-sn-glycerol-3-phosphate acyltransferase
MLTRRGGRTFLGSLFWLPISIVAWLGSFAWTVVLLLSMAPLLIFLPFHRIQLWWAHPMLGWPIHLTLSRYRITVDPRYDRSRTVVFVQNHVSMLDAFIACRGIRVPLCGLENAAHLKLPGYGWLLRGANAIPVDKGARSYKRIAEAMRERASRGISILTFPEGTRTLDGHVGSFRRGVFRMAIEAGLPIVPMAVRGAFRMLPKGAFTARPASLDVYMAPPIATADLTLDDLPELMARTHAVLEGWVERREMLGDLCGAPFREQPEHAAE